MTEPLSAIIIALAPFVALYTVFWLMFFRGKGRRYMPFAPTTLLRGRRGPFPHSSKGALGLWSAYALAMVLATQLVEDASSFYDVSTNAAGHPPTRVVVVLVVLIACLLAAIMVLPGAIGHPVLQYLAVFMTFVVAFADPWIGSIAQVVVAVVVLGYGGVVGAVLHWMSVVMSYCVLYIDDGSAAVTLSVVMTVLLGTLTLLLIVMSKTMSFALVLGIVLVVAIVGAATLPLM